MKLKSNWKNQSISAAIVFCLLHFALCVFPLSVSAHRFHTSLTRIDYNDKEKLVEISIQTFTHDLEPALERMENVRRVNLEKTPKIDELILKYLGERFVLKNKAGEQKRLRWVGMEQKTDAVWLYVEAEMPEGLAGASLENRILHEMHSNQINYVVARFDNSKTDLVFKVGDKAQPLVKPTEISK